MAWLLVTSTAVLALAVLVLAVVVLRLRGRVRALEQRPLSPSMSPSSDANVLSKPRPDSTSASLDGERRAPEFVITRIGEPEVEVGRASDAPAVPTVAAPVFADLVLKETVVQTASLVHGLRRALAPETRNRIRFHVRQEVKRSRKQRRSELREVRREWAAQKRAAAEDTAA